MDKIYKEGEEWWIWPSCTKQGGALCQFFRSPGDLPVPLVANLWLRQKGFHQGAPQRCSDSGHVELAWKRPRLYTAELLARRRGGLQQSLWMHKKQKPWDVWDPSTISGNVLAVQGYIGSIASRGVPSMHSLFKVREPHSLQPIPWFLVLFLCVTGPLWHTELNQLKFSSWFHKKLCVNACNTR